MGYAASWQERYRGCQHLPLALQSNRSELKDFLLHSLKLDPANISGKRMSPMLPSCRSRVFQQNYTFSMSLKKCIISILISARSGAWHGVSYWLFPQLKIFLTQYSTMFSHLMHRSPRTLWKPECHGSSAFASRECTDVVDVSTQLFPQAEHSQPLIRFCINLNICLLYPLVSHKSPAIG